MPAVERGGAAEEGRRGGPERRHAADAAEGRRRTAASPRRRMRRRDASQRPAEGEHRSSVAVVGGLLVEPSPSSSRKFRNRPVAGSNASRMKRSECHALCATASQPSTRRARDRRSGRARRRRCSTRRQVGRRPIACCQIPSSPVMARKVQPVDGMERASPTDGREPRPAADGRAAGTSAERTAPPARRSGCTRPPRSTTPCPGCTRRRACRSPAPLADPEQVDERVGERRRGLGSHEATPAAGEPLLGIGVGRGHDRLPRAHRVRQGPGHDLVHVGVGGDEQVRGLEPRPELHAPDEPVDEPHGVSPRRRRRPPRGALDRPRPRAPEVRMRRPEDHVHGRRIACTTAGIAAIADS